jgi:hypothetical protein
VVGPLESSRSILEYIFQFLQLSKIAVSSGAECTGGVQERSRRADRIASQVKIKSDISVTEVTLS